MLASTRYPSHPDWQHNNNPIEWVKWPWTDMPTGMMSGEEYDFM